MNNNLVLQLKTAPAESLGLSENGLTRFNKELIRVGSYVKDSTKQKFTVAIETLNHWVKTFDLWLANGNKVSIPLSHETAGDASDNQGWVTSLSVEGNSLFGIMELKDPKLALTSDVSIYVPVAVIDGKGIEYKAPITHVALCTDPVIPGLESFEKLELSKGVTNMDFLKKLCKTLGLSGDKATEDGVSAALDSLLPAGKKEESAKDLNPLAVLMSDNRALKLNGLLEAGRITPDIKDLIEARYVVQKACVLELSQKDGSDGFNFLFDVLSKNKPAELGEKTGVQSLELSNSQTGKADPLEADVKKRRVAAGLKD